jgi:MinD-like ATPase involved in chromosome partitioning or flagellar assembly
MDNDTPQTSGDDAPDHATQGPGWPDGAVGTARLAEAPHDVVGTQEADPESAQEADPYISHGPNPFSSVYPQGSGPFPQRGAAAQQAANAWGGWDGSEEADPAANGYPRPSFRAAAPGYPRVPGYAPAPREQPRHAATGYAQDPQYLAYDPDPGYEHDRRYAPGYQHDPGYAPGSEYGPDPGYGYDPAFLPPLEPLPDPADGPAEGPPWEHAPAVSPPQPLLAAPAPAPPAPAPGMMPRVTAQDWRGAVRDDLPAPPAEHDAEAARPTSDSLTSELLLHGRRVAPASGWRKGIYRVTGGLLRFGESAAEMRRRDLINRVRTPVAGGHHRIAVLSLKGGVGKTTTAVGLGATLATLRGDRVIAVDANPDRGTLSDKVRLETSATVRDLLNERDQIRRYADARAFTSQAPSRLEVLASDRDPGVSVAFGAEDYCDAARVLEHFYSICITDCGTGLLHSAMSGVLRLADQIVVVSSPSVDGARSASATLDWLEAHNCGDLVRNGVVVLSAIRPRSKSTVDLDRLQHHFAARCRAVTRIPYDAHLEEGAEVELELLSSETADAYLALAAIVGDGLAWPRRLTSRPALP